MVKILNFILTKIEKHTLSKQKKELYRNILNSIDKYNYERYGISTFRYYRYLNFSVDDIERKN